MSFLADLFVDMVIAMGPSVGFGMVGHVPARMLKYCALGGAVGHGLRFLMLHAGVPIEWASLVAAMAVSFAGLKAGQWLRADPKTFTVSAVMPMVPGVSFYTALVAIVQIHQTGCTPALLATALDSGLKAFLIIAALAVGLAMPGLLLYRRKLLV